MIVIFCDSPLDQKQVDPDYEIEYASCRKKDIPAFLISYEALTLEDNPGKAVKKVPLFERPRLAVYRGWMVTPSLYEKLYNALQMKNVVLINNPGEYKYCHYLPESYSEIKDHTPLSTWYIWKNRIDLDEIMEKLAVFKGKPVIVKDFVKSQKHNWEEACFIPDSEDSRKVEKVVQKFIELQGTSLQEGLVFREYAELTQIATHSKSGMPLFLEYRLFFLNKKLVGLFPYWEEGEYPADTINLEHFCSIAGTIKSNFFTMDIALKSDGNWIVIELGDGQVSGLPERAETDSFYGGLQCY